ncbi:MAG: hypothetical protein RMM53_06670 [Bacteroidia bacterium]|nr:hypothetical protein [Bacteroidia bacterium]
MRPGFRDEEKFKNTGATTVGKWFGNVESNASVGLRVVSPRGAGFVRLLTAEILSIFAIRV